MKIDFAKTEKTMCTRRQRFVLCHVQQIRRKVLATAAIVLVLVVVYVVFLRRKTTPTVFVIEEHHEGKLITIRRWRVGLLDKRW